MTPPQKGGIVFVGSSTIRRWDTAAYFPDLKIINRGFGGSELADAVRYVDRIVIPYEPRLVVVYSGDNDISGGRRRKRSPCSSSASRALCTPSSRKRASC